MDKQRQDDQPKPTYNSSVPIQDLALKTYWKRWMIEKSGGRGLRDPCCWHDIMMMMKYSMLFTCSWD